MRSRGSILVESLVVVGIVLVGIVGSKMHWIKLNEFSPPKHVYASFYDETAGRYFDRMYISKHCKQLARQREGSSTSA